MQVQNGKSGKKFLVVLLTMLVLGAVFLMTPVSYFFKVASYIPIVNSRLCAEFLETLAEEEDKRVLKHYYDAGCSLELLDRFGLLGAYFDEDGDFK